MATKTKEAAAPRITLADRLRDVEQVETWIDEHGDELLANGGELPPALAALVDVAERGLAEKVEARAAVILHLQDDAKVCQSWEARYRQRRTVLEHAAKGLKEFTKTQLEAAGQLRVETPLGVVRVQDNPQPSVRHDFDGESLLAIADGAAAGDEAALFPASRLAEFIRVETVRTATLDTKALLAAYQAREQALLTEAEGLVAGYDDLSEREQEALDVEVSAAAEAAGIAEPDEAFGAPYLTAAITWARRAYVREMLAAEFPGVTVTRGTHLRIG